MRMVTLRYGEVQMRWTWEVLQALTRASQERSDDSDRTDSDDADLCSSIHLQAIRHTELDFRTDTTGNKTFAPTPSSEFIT